MPTVVFVGGSSMICGSAAFVQAGTCRSYQYAPSSQRRLTASPCHRDQYHQHRRLSIAFDSIAKLRCGRQHSSFTQEPFALAQMKQWACKADNRLWLPVSRWLSSLKKKEPSATTTAAAIHEPLPPAPRELIAKRTVYELPILNRRAPQEGDEPLKALYRIYEHLLLDQWLEIRNEFEAFWYHSSWAICEIPDPKDPDPERYACLACIPKLLRVAFNQRIRFGLPRDAPPIFTGKMMEEWKKRDKQFEELPAWVEGVPPVRDLLAIPHWDNSKRDFVTLTGFEDEGASSECASKNILILQPHIHFM